MMKIIVRLCKDDSSPVVFIPSIPANAGFVMSWQPIGQHGEASLDFYRNGTKPAGDKEKQIATQYANEIGEECEIIKRLIVSTIGKPEKLNLNRWNVDEFTLGYAECAIWSSTDESNEQGGEPIDRNYSLDDITRECWQRFHEDCKDFQKSNAELLRKYCELRDIPDNAEYTPMECAGHDFWLTRNGHGAGFWDRGIGETGDKLSDAAKVYGEANIYVYRGKIHHY